MQRNVRPERPDDEDAPHLSDAVWTLAEKCWGKDPTSRPTASALCDIISHIPQTATIARPAPILVSSQINHTQDTPSSSVPSQPSQHHPLNTPDLLIQGHTDRVICVTFSPDGKYIISSSGDLTIRMWDARTGEPALPPLKSHTYPVFALSFSSDGRRIASGSQDNTALVWDALNGQVIAGPFQGHTCAVYSVVFSPDGQQIVSGSADKTIRVWDIQTERTVVGPLKGHTDYVENVAFSPDGKQIASGSKDTTVRVWDLDSGRLVQGPLMKHGGAVYLVEFSPDGKRLVSVAYDGYVCVWDVGTGSLLSGPMDRHPEGSLDVRHTPSSGYYAVSPDGKWLVGRSSEGLSVRVWDSLTRLVVADFDAHTMWKDSVTFSPDCKRIGVSSPDNDTTVRVYTVNW